MEMAEEEKQEGTRNAQISSSSILQDLSSRQDLKLEPRQVSWHIH